MPDDSGTRARMPTLRCCASREEQLGRALAEDVEDDLHRLHAGILDGLERLFHLFHADAVIAQLALLAPDRPARRRLRACNRPRSAGSAAAPDRACPFPDSSGCARRRRSGSRGCSRSATCGSSRRPALVATTMSSLRSRFNCASSRSLWPSPYTSAVSKKFTPRSTARCSAVDDSLSSTAAPRAADGPRAKADRRDFPTGAS